MASFTPLELELIAEANRKAKARGAWIDPYQKRERPMVIEDATIIEAKIAEADATMERAVAELAEPQDHSRRGHSPLGASGAERWMRCPGSVALLKHLDLGESDEEDYRRIGTALHEAAATALIQDLEPYELTGSTFNNTVIDAELAQALGDYLRYARRFMGDGWVHYVEYAISAPSLHPLFYGTMDFGAFLYPVIGRIPERVKAVDLKGGEGIAVEVVNNPQLKYYAAGLIDGVERQDGIVIPDDVPVDLAIAQPRLAWHPDGTVREWTTTVGAIKAWVRDVLVPAMNATQWDDRLDAGDHCRFCPAKLACPLLTALFGAAATANAKHIPDMSDQAIGLNYVKADAVKHYIRALEREALDRQMKGRVVEGLKLVRKKANRVWKAGAAELARAKFGADALTKPELKSPAELEKLPAAKTWVHEWAYIPDTGVTVALADDARQGVKVKPADEIFKAYMAKEG